MFKFGAAHHIEQFAHGLLYMNTLKYFVELETGSPRKDSDEGTSHLWRGNGAMLQVELEGRFMPVGEIREVRSRPNALQTVNVFCMYALRESSSDRFVDPRNSAFGDTFAILTDFDEFMKRVRTAVPGLGSAQELQYGLVTYVDTATYEGPVGIFTKGSDFSFQSEFRIGLLPGTGAPLRLHVGDLCDIVVFGRLSDLNDRLRVQVNAQGRRELQIRN